MASVGEEGGGGGVAAYSRGDRELGDAGRFGEAPARRRAPAEREKGNERGGKLRSVARRLCRQRAEHGRVMRQRGA
jgi:hypothetical protein